MNDKSISFILSLPLDMKVKILRDALTEDRFDVFFEMSKVLLEAPISEGGLPTELIEGIHTDYIKEATALHTICPEGPIADDEIISPLYPECEYYSNVKNLEP